MSTNRTIALDNLYGYRWVDWFMTWPGYTRLPTLALVLGALVTLGLLAVNDIAGVLSIALLFGNTLLLIAIWVIMSRGAQADLASVSAAGHVAGLAPTKAQALIENLLGIASGVGAMVFLLQLQGIPLLPGETSSPGYAVFWSISWTVMLANNITLFHFLGYVVRQGIVFSRVAKDVRLSLSRLDEIQSLSNPLIRYLFLISVATGLLLLSIEFIPDRIQSFVRTYLIAPPAIAAIGLAAFPLYPILLLRARIRGLKQRELMLIKRALAGDRDALGDSELGERHIEFATPDLMYYEDRIARTWEWPIQQHMQRILFYVLIPPAAWVAAAVVERLLDTYLG